MLGKQLQVAVHRYDVAEQFPDRKQLPQNRAITFMPVEWNIKNDPVAAKIVFDSGVPIRVAGLDVTFQLKIRCTDFMNASCAKVLEPAGCAGLFWEIT